VVIVAAHGDHGHGDGDWHHHLPGAMIPNAAAMAVMMMVVIIIVGVDDVVSGMAVPIIIIVGMPMVMAMIVMAALVPLRGFPSLLPLSRISNTRRLEFLDKSVCEL
jgi:hypothetical protein